MAAFPFGPQAWHISVGDPDRSGKGTGLAADPAPPDQYRGQQDDDHPQIDAKHSEQGDKHFPKRYPDCSP